MDLIDIPADPLSPDWHEARRSFIGASDAPAILGLSPWRNSLDVWAEKMGLTQPSPPTIATDLGHELEDFIARRWLKENAGEYVGRLNIINHASTIRSRTHQWLAVSPDRWVMEDDERIGLLECKLVGGHMTATWADGPPLYVVCQAMIQMAVMEVPWVDVCSLHAGRGWDWRCHRIHRNDTEIDDLLARLGDWWNRHVVGGERPEPVGGRVSDTLNELHPPPDGTSAVLLPPDAQGLIEELKRAKALRADLSDDVEHLENRLKAMLGDHTDGQLDPNEAPVVTWRTASKTTHDIKAILERTGPKLDGFTADEIIKAVEILRAVERTSTFRVLRVR